MNNRPLYQIFKELNTFTSNDNYFDVMSIPSMPHKIGKTEEGWPKLFVKTIDSKCARHNIKGELLWVEYNVDCTIVDEKQNLVDARFAIVTLRSNDSSLQRIFLEIFLLSLSTMPNEPTDQEFSIKIEGLLSIFSSLRKTPIHKIQGLWAELLIIEKSSDIELLAKAWHNSPSAKYDFTKGEDKIEVKSTSSEERIHKFSLDQLNPTPSSSLLIASVIVRESAKDENGLSVMDLYERICKKITQVDIRIHLYSAIVNTLGNEYDKALNVFFDYSQAKDSLAFYDYKDVPRPLKENIPPMVSGVSFYSNLSGIDDVYKKNVTFAINSLFYAL